MVGGSAEKAVALSSHGNSVQHSRRKGHQGALMAGSLVVSIDG